MDKVLVHVVYGSAPIRDIAVRCPQCGLWFAGRDIFKITPRDKEDILNLASEINADREHNSSVYTADKTRHLCCPSCGYDPSSSDSFMGIDVSEVKSTPLTAKKYTIWK